MSEARFVREYIANHGYPAPEATWNPDTHCEQKVTISLTPEEMLQIGSTWAITVNGPHGARGIQTMMAWAKLGMEFEPGYNYSREICAWCAMDLLGVGTNFVVLMTIAPEKVGIGAPLPDFVLDAITDTVTKLQTALLDQLGFSPRTMEREWDAARCRHS